MDLPLPPALLTPLAVFGLISLAFISFRIALFILSHLWSVIRPPINVAKFGKWAVVTGATDGIGKAYAEELAKRGVSLFLISRSPDKLKTVADEFSQKYRKIEVRYHAADFSRGHAIYPDIEKTLAGLEIGILVNNVGASYDYPEYFLDVPQEKIDYLLNLNIVSVNQMTKVVLPRMVARQKGAIINVSSASGAFPAPLLAVYAGTKAYVDFFSRCLQAEYRKDKIVVQSLIPLYVTSNLSKLRKAQLTIPNPSTYARSAIRSLGRDERTTGYLFHQLQLDMTNILPESYLSNMIYKSHLYVRNKALKRQAEKDAAAKKQ